MCQSKEADKAFAKPLISLVIAQGLYPFACGYCVQGCNPWTIVVSAVLIVIFDYYLGKIFL